MMIFSRKWLVCLGCFLIQFTVFGIHNNYGIFYNELIEKFNQPPAETALIGSLSSSLTFLAGPLSHILTKRIGFNAIMLISILLSITGLISASFVVTDTILLALTFSFLWGTGTGFANHAVLVVLQKNFDKQISLANGIASSGTGIGTFMIGPLITFILDKYDIRWLFRTLAVFPLLFLFSIIFNKPNNTNPSLEITSVEDSNNNQMESKENDDLHIQLETESRNSSNKISELHNSNAHDNSMTSLACQKHPNDVIELSCTEFNNDQDDSYTSNPIETSIDKLLPITTISMTSSDKSIKLCTATKKSIFKEIFDKELWTHKPYLILISGVFIFFFGFQTPFIFLVHHVTSLGISKSSAQFLMGVLAIVSTCCKIISGVILNFQTLINRSTVFLLAMYMIAFSHLLVIFGSEYWHFCLYAAIYGLAEGCIVGQIAAVTVDNVPSKDMIGQAIGNLFAIIAIPVMIGPLISGHMSALLKSNTVPFMFAAGFCLLGSIITTMIRFFNKKIVPVSIDCDIGGVTKIHLLEPSLLCSKESLLVTNTCSATFSGFKRSESYRGKTDEADDDWKS